MWTTGVRVLRIARVLLVATAVGCAKPTITPVGVNGLRPSASADGRFVAFEMAPPNELGTIVINDRKAGTMARAAPGHASFASLSADGRILAFESPMAFVADDTNDPFCPGVSSNIATCDDIYVLDRTTGLTTRVSVASDGTQANAASTNPHVSNDGRFVVFESRATNLTTDHVDGRDTNIFLRDRVTNTTTLVSVARDGTAIGGWRPSISDDGATIVFIADTAFYVREVREARMGTIRRVAAAELVAPGAHGAHVSTTTASSSTFVKEAFLSGDGKTVIVSVGTDLPSPPPGPGVMRWSRIRYDLVLYTIANGQARLLDSVDTLENLANRRYASHLAGFSNIAVSGTGRVVAYCRHTQGPALASPLSVPDTRWEFRLIDTDTQRARLMTDPDLTPPRCLGHALSRDGTLLFFVPKPRS